MLDDGEVGEVGPVGGVGPDEVPDGPLPPHPIMSASTMVLKANVLARSMGHAEPVRSIAGCMSGESA